MQTQTITLSGEVGDWNKSMKMWSDLSCDMLSMWHVFRIAFTLYWTFLHVGREWESKCTCSSLARWLGSLVTREQSPPGRALRPHTFPTKIQWAPNPRHVKTSIVLPLKKGTKEDDSNILSYYIYFCPGTQGLRRTSPTWIHPMQSDKTKLWGMPHWKSFLFDPFLFFLPFENYASLL